MLKPNAILMTALILFFGLVGSAYGFDAMRIQIRTVLPSEIATIGAAAQYYADVTGYRLTTAFPAPAESNQIAAEQISPLAFTDKVLAVEDAILALLREPYQLVIDHEHKLFSFEQGEIK